MQRVRPLVGAVRITRGMTQTDVAAATGVSQAVVSGIEAGRVTPDQVWMDRVAAVLDADAAQLATPAPETRVLHRLPASAPRRAVAAAHAELAVAHAERRGDEAFVTTQTSGDPAELAQSVRRAWQLDAGPLLNVRRAAEMHGVTCLPRNINPLRADAVGSWPVGARGIVLISHEADVANLRIAVAHEIGHAVIGDGDEEGADAFAREFLLPAPDVYSDLGALTDSTLKVIAERWGVPGSFLVRRALYAGVITAHRHRVLLASARSHPRVRPAS
ncbi:helix-turn-helix domain-containing protein [Microbacterium aurum]|nr:XRE family transcriptional regulator [Microbacterium aurum]